MKAALAIAILAVAGCATKAQQEVSRIQGVAAADAPVIDACWRGTVASPPYQALKAKMGEYSDSPTLGMKLNADKATAQEAAQVLALRRDYLTPCRKIALESAARVDPAIVAILAENYAKADANYAKFSTHMISWGEFVTENQALVTERRANLLAAGEGIQKGLKGSPAVATTPRQQAEAALSNWTQQQRNLLGGHRVMNCQYTGSMLSCTSD